jgi:hypothetical protein
MPSAVTFLRQVGAISQQQAAATTGSRPNDPHNAFFLRHLNRLPEALHEEERKTAGT